MPVTSLCQLAGALDEHKAAGKRIVMGNGCFDLLHAGHLEYLEGAKALGDILVVGVNSDASIRAYKHNSPVMGEADRAGLVAALRWVDYVFLFKEPTLDSSLNSIRPHMLALGIDKKNSRIPETQLCGELGIAVRYIGRAKVNSSTQLAEALYRRFAGRIDITKEADTIGS